MAAPRRIRRGRQGAARGETAHGQGSGPVRAPSAANRGTRAGSLKEVMRAIRAPAVVSTWTPYGSRRPPAVRRWTTTAGWVLAWAGTMDQRPGRMTRRGREPGAGGGAGEPRGVGG